MMLGICHVMTRCQVLHRKQTVCSYQVVNAVDKPIYTASGPRLEVPCSILLIYPRMKEAKNERISKAMQITPYPVRFK